MIEVYDSSENEVAEGNFGGIVHKYKEVKGLEFPLVKLDCTKMEKYKVEVIKALISFDCAEPVTVYLSLHGQMMRVGVIDRSKLRILLTSDVLNGIDKTIYLSEEERLEGDMMFAFCT